RRNVFARVAFDVTDNINIFTMYNYATSITHTAAYTEWYEGNGPVILSGNPFIPASVQAAMTAQGIASFQIGTLSYDEGDVQNLAVRQTSRYAVGASGKFSFSNRENWTWNAYIEYGQAKFNSTASNLGIKANLANAENAVRAPNGAIVCASTLNPALT